MNLHEILPSKTGAFTPLINRLTWLSYDFGRRFGISTIQGTHSQVFGAGDVDFNHD